MKRIKFSIMILLLLILAACTMGPPTYFDSRNTYESTPDMNMAKTSESSMISSSDYAVTQSAQLETSAYDDALKQVATLVDTLDITMHQSRNYPYNPIRISYLQHRNLQVTEYQLSIPKDQLDTFKEKLAEFGELVTNFSESNQIAKDPIAEEIKYHKDEIARLEQEIEKLSESQARLRNELHNEIRGHELSIRLLEEQQETVQTDRQEVTFNLTVREIDPAANPLQARTTGGAIVAHFTVMMQRIGWAIFDTLFAIFWVVPYIVPVIVFIIALSFVIRGVRWIWFWVHPGAKERSVYRKVRREALAKRYDKWLEKVDNEDGDGVD